MLMLRLPIIFASQILVISSVFLPILPVSGQTEKGSNVDTVRFIHREDENLALEEVRSGSLDIYYFRIPLEAAADAAQDSRLRVYDRSAGSMGVLVNPAPSGDVNKINPFEFRQVRFALNYLIDRDFIVNEILRGYGSPLADPFGIYSPEYPNVIDIVESFGFRHNPAVADRMISESLTTAGASKADNGKWEYNGTPITVRILIRQDDAPRKAMGEEIASQLEKIGFTVTKEYGDLNKANAVVYGSDPQELQWQIYTEGFAGTAVFVKYNPVIPAQMFAPWFGRMPGGQNPEFWNYENATLDQITQSILFFNFTSEQERNELVRQAVEMGIQEAVRIFVAQKTDPFVAASRIDGLVNDFGAGITSKYSLLNARSTEGKNTLNVGVKQIYQGSWNSIAGLTDVYSRDIHTLIADTATFRNPYTGDIIPLRANWTGVSTAGPSDMLDVPVDAVTWNASLHQWVEVGQGSNATSKVTFKPLYSNWHHGIPMDISDMMFIEYFFYEWGTNLGEGDRTVDPEYTAQAEVAIPYSKGFRVVGPSEIESYIDIWHYDETEIADSGVFWASEPWEITAATERLVIAGKLAYSRNQATVNNVEWLDPIVPDHAQMIGDELQKMRNEGYVPIALKNILTLEEARNRYDASIKWIGTHKHAVISNGAFYVDSYNIAGKIITVKAFRDSSYPYEVGHWSMYEKPKLADISKVDIPSSLSIGNNPIPRSLFIGESATIVLNISVDGQPSNDATIDFFVLDKNGSAVTSGKAIHTNEAGEYRIELSADETSKLSPGPNQLRIFANSIYAFRPDISERTILAVEPTSA
jgi:peptide/nickel transport system substrate-binding protein